VFVESNLNLGKNLQLKAPNEIQSTTVAGKKFDHFKGLSMVLLGAVLWGVSGTAAQVLFQRYGFSPGWLVTVRMSIAGLLLLIGVAIRSGLKDTLAVWKDKKDAVRLILLGIIGLLGVQYSYFAAIRYGNAATGTKRNHPIRGSSSRDAYRTMVHVAHLESTRCRQMMAVISVTWKEVLRKRVLVITIVLTLLFLLLEAFGAYGLKQVSSIADKRELGRSFMSLSLYLSNFIVAYLSIFSAAGTISGEVENGILLSILPRPVPRWHVFLGKWLGYASWSALYGFLLYWAQVLIVGWQYGFSTFNSSVWMTSVEWMMIPLILTSLSILGSTYFPTLGNGIFVMLIFSFGLLGGFLEVLSVPSASSTIADIGMFISFFVPTDAIYRLVIYSVTGGGSGSSLSKFGPFSSPIVPNHLFLLYVAGYIFVLVIWGIVRFSKKDI
jgi:ABC-type transport system involved in multi-copper enzyme maturation permease subunit